MDIINRSINLFLDESIAIFERQDENKRYSPEEIVEWLKRQKMK